MRNEEERTLQMSQNDSESSARRPRRIGRMVRIGSVRHIRWYARMSRPPRVGRMIEVGYEQRLRADRGKRDGRQGQDRD